MEQKFYICSHCGNIIAMVKDKGVPVMCCGQKMTRLEPGVTDGAAEKHLPVWKKEGNKVFVTVGSVAHPMTEAHLIQWVVLQTEQGVQRKELAADAEPKAVFALAEGDKAVAAYAYCNLHGLWKTDL